MAAKIIERNQWSVSTNAIEVNSIDGDHQHVKLTLKQPSKDPREGTRAMDVAAQIVVSTEELADLICGLQRFVHQKAVR